MVGQVHRGRRTEGLDILGCVGYPSVMGETSENSVTVYKVAELARMWRVTERTIQLYIEAGEFPNAYKVGRGRGSHWRIPAADVRAFIQRQQKAS